MRKIVDYLLWSGNLFLRHLCEIVANRVDQELQPIRPAVRR